MNYKNTVFLMFFICLLGNASWSLAMKPDKSIIFSGSTGINNFFNMISQNIEERTKRLYKLGEINDINVLRQELKKCGDDKEAWDKVNTRGAGPTPQMIAQKNNYHASSILLYNYNRSDDPFFQAIMFGDKSKIDDILKKNPEKINTNIVIDNGQCSRLPLSWAITLKDEELVKYFLKKGAKIDLKTSIGIRPFDEACNSPKILKLMAPYGGTKLQRQQDFFKAVGDDDIEKMKELVSRNVQSKLNIITEPLGGFFTPLKCAVLKGNIKAAQYLINNDAFKGPDSYKRELFLHACMSKKIPMIHLLLINEADINFYLKKSHNNTHCPFSYYLSDEIKQELFALYKKHHATTGQELLSLATKLGHENLIEQSLNEGVDIDEYDSQKMTALLWACSYGNPNSVSFLIQHNANVNALDKKGRCCLRKLIRMHKTSPQKQGRQLTTSELLPCLLLLVCHGANKNIKDNRGESTLDWVKKQNFDIDEKNLISRVFDAYQLSENDLICLLNDIYAFQCEELKQVQAKNNKQAIYYIKRSLVKHNIKAFGLSLGKKEYYEDLIHAQLKRQKK